MTAAQTSGVSVRRVPNRSAFWAMLVSEWTQLRREPVSIVWGLVIPVIAVAVLGAVPGTRKALDYYQGQSVVEHYVPIIVLVSLAMLGVNALPPVLATYRERGVLRRLFVTPAKPSWLLGAVALIHLGVAVLATGLILIVARTFYAVRLPGQPLAWSLAFALSAAAVLGLGMLVASAVPNAKVANGTGAVLFFPLMFLAGLWVPANSLPTWLHRISDYSPLGAAVRALTSAAAGSWPSVSAAATLATYAIVLPIVAVRFFRWD
jgi:ABC-2 type transport system permease protein